MIVAVLRSMKYDSNEARTLLPTILQFKRLLTDQELINTFKTETSRVPHWMFLEWIPQILSHFDFGKSCFLDELLLNLSESYPSALLYPFRLSYEQYISVKSNKFIKLRELVNNIKVKLTNNTSDNFIKGIINLCLPIVKLKYHLDRLDKFLSQTAFDELIPKEKYVFELKQIDDTVFEMNDTKSSDIYKVIEPYRNKLKSLNEIDANTERTLILSKLRTLMVSIVDQISRIKYKEIKLSNMSHWLSNFKMANNNGTNHLEIPGQYTGKTKPNIMSHVKITRFAAFVQIYDSLRKPVKITIYGDNGRCYNFLVKYGEDLRQDQRIQKLFSIMSTQMNMDANCRRHELSIQTFEVIPISNVCGMSSWLENTMTLKCFTDDSVKRRYREEESIIMKAVFKYRAYANGIMEKPRELVIIFMKCLINILVYIKAVEGFIIEFKNIYVYDIIKFVL